MTLGNSGTSCGQRRNCTYDHVLLRRNRGHKGGATGCWMFPEDLETILQGSIHAQWPVCGPGKPVFFYGGIMLRVTDADPYGCMPQALRTTFRSPKKKQGAYTHTVWHPAVLLYNDCGRCPR